MYAFLTKHYFIVREECGSWYYKNSLEDEWENVPFNMIDAALGHVRVKALASLQGYAKYMAELKHLHHVPSEALDQYYSTASKATRELVCTLYGVPIDEFIANEKSCYE